MGEASAVRFLHVDLADVKAVCLARVRYGETHHYWADTWEAANLLGVTIKRVHQLIRKDYLPAVQGPNGRWYSRRAQLEVVANARNARRWADLA